MNWVDLVVIALAVLAAISGSRQGMVTALFSFAGVLVGAILGVRLAPLVVERFANPTSKVAFGVALVVLLVALGETLGMWIGRSIKIKISTTKLTGTDNVLGAIVQGLAVFVVAWLVAVPLTSVGAFPGLASAVKRSLVLHVVDGVMPSQVRALPGELRKVLDGSGFPDALAPFTTAPNAEVGPPDPALAGSPVVSRVRPSVVKIRGQAPSCSRALEGTGFSIAPHRVMTNAHVVAGTNRVSVEIGSGELDARVVLYDPDLDVAVLDVPDLTATPLRFTQQQAAPGQDAVVVGYPLDGPYTAVSARVRDEINLRGPNIYEAKTVSREVYPVRATVRSGNSGGPLVDPQGRVIGVVFGAAVDDPETGFVLTGQQVSGDVAESPRLTSEVSTGACAK